MGKSKVACDMSIESLLEGKNTCYLWTFTVPDVVSARETALRWNKCQRKLVSRLGFVGVRVFEYHPRGHGLHVHLVTHRRINVNDVRVITTRYGFGRINVKAIPAIAGNYVSKYVTKQTVEAYPELKGLRLWARVGTKLTAWRGTRVSDVFVDCDALHLFRRWLPLLDFERARSFHCINRLFNYARLVRAGVCDYKITEVHDKDVPELTSFSFQFWFIHPITLQCLGGFAWI